MFSFNPPERTSESFDILMFFVGGEGQQEVLGESIKAILHDFLSLVSPWEEGTKFPIL